MPTEKNTDGLSNVYLFCSYYTAPVFGGVEAASGSAQIFSIMWRFGGVL